MSDRCRWLNDPEIGRWHLPGCMGGAVYGPNQCTCGKPVRPKRTADVDDLERRISRLERLSAPH